VILWLLYTIYNTIAYRTRSILSLCMFDKVSTYRRQTIPLALHQVDQRPLFRLTCSPLPLHSHHSHHAHLSRAHKKHSVLTSKASTVQVPPCIFTSPWTVGLHHPVVYPPGILLCSTPPPFLCSSLQTIFCLALSLSLLYSHHLYVRAPWVSLHNSKTHSSKPRHALL
jgi:hypothetical protein